jgi:hypothetical protein
MTDWNASPESPEGNISQLDGTWARVRSEHLRLREFGDVIADVFLNA